MIEALAKRAIKDIGNHAAFVHADPADKPGVDWKLRFIDTLQKSIDVAVPVLIADSDDMIITRIRAKLATRLRL